MAFPPKWFANGVKLRVKSLPWTREYGLRTHGAWQAKGDDRAWPGDVGTLEGRPFAGETLWIVNFPRGRTFALNSARDLEDFVRVPRPRGTTASKKPATAQDD